MKNIIKRIFVTTLILSSIFSGSSSISAASTTAKKYTCTKSSAKKLIEKRLKASETYAKDTLKVKFADYSDFDPKVAEEINYKIYKLYEVCPDMTGSIKRITTLQKFYKGVATTLSAQKNDEYKEEIKKFVNAQKAADNLFSAYIKTSNVSDCLATYDGLGINLEFAKSYNGIKNSLGKENLNHFPVGCSTISHVVDHELGHLLTQYLHLNYDENIWKYYSALTTDNIKKNVSDYAATNFDEFISECWGEYNNSPKPRTISKAVGDIIVSELKN